MPDLVGKMLSKRYRIEELIGRGGMAEVYRANDTRRGYPVAIKVLREDLAEDREFIRRFQSEAHALASLQHANIVRFYSIERDDYLAFIVMDYIDGETLRRCLLRAEGPLPMQEAYNILQQIGLALHFAHAEGMLHRDVKPGNIMITADGRALLADFGIAKLMDTATVTTMMPGTPAYMSPEQFLNRPVGIQSDIYSLGVTAYEMLAGRRPFLGDSESSDSSQRRAVLQTEHLEKLPPPPSTYNPALSRNVDRTILKALAKKPEDRFSSVPEFLAELGIGDSASPLTPLSTPWRGAGGEVPRPITPVSAAPGVIPPIERPIPSRTAPKTPGWFWALIGGVAVIVLMIGVVLSSSILKPSPVVETQHVAYLPLTATATIIERVVTATVEPATSTPAQTSSPSPTETPALGIGSTQVSSKDGMVMVYVPAGEFIMGSETYSDEKPQRTVTLEAFWIDQTEVTNAMYARCMESGTCRATASGRTTIAGYENYPVVVDRWEQAQAYCGWVGRQLPTEAEWEKAARGTNGGTYPWGEGANCGQANYGKCTGEVQPVGSYPDFASPYGALDMAGNLWEWMADVYPGTTDYMLKGGDWQTLAWGVRSAVRGGDWDTKEDVLWVGSWEGGGSCLGSGGRASGCDYRVVQGLGDYGFRCVLSP